ncbi:glycoprotein-N-acetylgalactosamine 3-beta-galactosyltransferase 1-like [Drosophila tropicalis]|uniref:glycoprotein-N-acetylgalactosamine 3-beta-galactosyltransferase 1-like n=1 Tax=Drosophila tropicalis TaxID=46794 RepID=UPI0035ABFA4F
MLAKFTRNLYKVLIRQSSSLYEREGPPSKTYILLPLTAGLIAGICLAQLFDTPETKYSCVSQRSINSQDKGVEHKNSYEPKDNYSTIADKLKKEVRILCWVMTNPKNHKERALHVKRTWGKRCNILLFMSSEEDAELPTVKLNVVEGRENLWGKVKEAFKYVYKHHYNDADWFYKADDDTYAVVENLRYMLYPYSPQTPIYFGFKLKRFIKQGYMSGGAGYVLSREALRRLVEKGLSSYEFYSPGIIEDVEIGRCMENLKVIAGDSRDITGRGRMFMFMPEHHLIKRDYEWYWSYQYYKDDDGLDCCSHLAISWHYVDPYLMYIMDYLIYNLKIHGLHRTLDPLPAKLKVGELLPPPIDQPADTNEDSVDDEDRFDNATMYKNDSHFSSMEVMKYKQMLKTLTLSNK